MFLKILSTTRIQKIKKKKQSNTDKKKPDGKIFYIYIYITKIRESQNLYTRIYI